MDSMHFDRFSHWTARPAAGLPDFSEREINKVWNELQSSSLEVKLAFLTDTRLIHNELFRVHTPTGFGTYSGNYRGTLGTPLEKRRAVMQYEHPYPGVSRLVRFIDPECVKQEMEILKDKIVRIDYTKRDQINHFYECVSIFRRFSVIHPYLNGNGRISRLMLALLAEIGGISRRKHWTFHVRPYDNFIGLCFQEYDKNPHGLVAYLARRFE